MFAQCDPNLANHLWDGHSVHRGVYCSLDELTTAPENWIKFWNASARPFRWTKTADQITDRICRYCSRISGPGHWLSQTGVVAVPPSGWAC